MASFGYIFELPPVGSTDVAKRELTVTVDNQDPPEVRVYPGQPTESDEWIFPDGADVSMTLVDVDGHGNRSPASAALTFNVVDDIAPPQPGELGVAKKREIP